MGLASKISGDTVGRSGGYRGAPDGNLQAGTVDGSTGLKTKISDQRDKEIDPTVAKRPQY